MSWIPLEGGKLAGTFELDRDKAGEHRFRLLASNGPTVLSSEGYSSRSSVVNGIESVRGNAGNPKRFESTATATGTFRFSLKAKNRQVDGTA